MLNLWLQLTKMPKRKLSNEVPESEQKSQSKNTHKDDAEKTEEMMSPQEEKKEVRLRKKNEKFQAGGKQKTIICVQLTFQHHLQFF